MNSILRWDGKTASTHVATALQPLCYGLCERANLAVGLLFTLLPVCMQGVPLSQGNLASSLANIIATYELGPEDKSLVVMPLFHVHGLMAGQAPISPSPPPAIS